MNASKSLEVKFCFVAELADGPKPPARQYRLYLYSPSQAIELFDTKTQRTLLSKCAVPGIRTADCFVGAKLMIYCRNFNLVDYGDNDTKLAFLNRSARSLFVVKPTAFKQVGKMMELLVQRHCTLGRVKAVRLEDTEAASLFEAHRTELFYKPQPCVVFEIFGAHERLACLPQEEGFLYTDEIVNVACKLLFNSSSTCAQMRPGCSVAIVKPHALLCAGAIIDTLLDKCEVTTIQSFYLDCSTASEFFEIYKDDAEPFQALVDQMSSGMCFVLEIAATPTTTTATTTGATTASDTAVSRLREVCGPADPEVAKKLCPHSLRGRFGIDRIKNAVHCSDLEQDGLLESTFFFSLYKP